MEVKMKTELALPAVPAFLNHAHNRNALPPRISNIPNKEMFNAQCPILNAQVRKDRPAHSPSF
jgi:hypothetical protein